MLIFKKVFSFVAIFTFMLSILFFPIQSKAEDNWDSYRWSDYNLNFQLPKNMTQGQNDSNRFVVKGDDLTFEIYPWKNTDVNEEDVAQEAYSQLEVKKPKIILSDKRDFSGFSGYEILGEGLYKNKEVNFAVLGFIDPSSSADFAVYIIYNPDSFDGVDIESQIIENISNSSDL